MNEKHEVGAAVVEDLRHFQAGLTGVMMSRSSICLV